MGLGAEEAIVRVSPLVPASKTDIAEIAKSVVEALLTRLGVVASIAPHSPPPVGEGDEAATPIALDIKGDDLGILIGRHGETLSCLQYIVRLIVAHKTESWLPITIDVEGYKQRRYEALRTLAQRIAEQVKAKGVPFTLRPMPAYERRIVHLTLADHPDVTTESTGEGEARKVVIEPKKQ